MTKVLFALFALAGLASADNGYLRVFHASPDAPAVDVWVNGKKTITDLPYGNATGFLAVPEGTYSIQVVPTGATSPVVINASLPVRAGIAETAVARGFLASIGVDVFLQDITKAEQTCGLRVAHLSPDAPAVDIIANGKVFLKGVSFPEFAPAIGHLDIPVGSYNIQVNLAGTSTTALSTTYNCRAGTRQSLTVIGSVSGSGATALKFAPLHDKVSPSA